MPAVYIFYNKRPSCKITKCTHKPVLFVSNRLSVEIYLRLNIILPTETILVAVWSVCVRVY